MDGYNDQVCMFEDMSFITTVYPLICLIVFYVISTVGNFRETKEKIAGAYVIRVSALLPCVLIVCISLKWKCC
jgi:hypothetical protein